MRGWGTIWRLTHQLYVLKGQVVILGLENCILDISTLHEKRVTVTGMTTL